MKTDSAVPEDIDAYIAGFPAEVQAILQRIRATVAQAAPGAKEAIKYRLPTFVLHENLVHFGAFKNHIGFYALPTGHAKFRRELSWTTDGLPPTKPRSIGSLRRVRVSAGCGRRAGRRTENSSPPREYRPEWTAPWR